MTPGVPVELRFEPLPLPTSGSAEFQILRVGLASRVALVYPRNEHQAAAMGWMSLRIPAPPPGSDRAPFKTTQLGALFPPWWLHGATGFST